MTFDIIIPTYKPGEEFKELLEKILIQTKKPNTIFIINTEERFWDKKFEAILPFQLIHINQNEFDHGGTRRMAAQMVESDFFVCMTQDAKPKDEKLFENLLCDFMDERTAIVYARQETDGKAGIIEKYTREFNYPKEKKIKTKEDVKTMGIKAWFSSDVCAVYRKKVYNDVGGFVSRTIFNEDMIIAHDVMEKGFQVVYEPNAMVIHYHEYSMKAQFQRNFDLGVSHKEFSHIFSKVSSEKEGGRLVKETVHYLLKSGKWYLIPKLIFHSGAKYLGFRLGKNYDRLPKWLVLKFCMNKGYFR